jgi:hypothetical protein
MTKKAAPKKKTNTTKTAKSVGLCSGTYIAEQVPGTVLIHAHGFHLTSGYRVFFEKSPLTISPPQYTLWHVEPSGPVLEVITPFSVSTSFTATEEVATVIIHDANGKNTVPVEQAPDLETKRAKYKRLSILAAADDIPGGCLDLSTAGQIVQNALPSGQHGIDDTLAQAGLINDQLRATFRDDVFDRVRSVGCHIEKEAIPNSAGTTIRQVRRALADTAS